MTVELVDTEEVVKYEPKREVGSVVTLRGLLERQSKSMLDVLPQHVTPQRLMKTMLLAFNRQPKLLSCTQESVLEAVMQSAELGLDVSGTLGEAYLVPYKGKATFIPGYRGLAKLARHSGEIANLEAEVVYERDHFVYQKGTDFRVEFRPRIDGERGDQIGAYALVQFKDGGAQADFMTVPEIEKIRMKSLGKDLAPWTQHWNEMARKTVFRRLAKWLPLSGEKWQAALEVDNATYDLDMRAVTEIPVPVSDDADQEA